MTRPFQDIKMFRLKPLECCFSSMLRVIVMLEGEPSQSHISGSLKQVTMTWRQQRWSPHFAFLGNYSVFCFFMYYFLRAHSSPFPSILLADVKSLDNKADEFQARVAFQRDIRDCNILFSQPPSFFTHCADRNKHLSAKKKGRAVCLMINKSWCDHNNIQELKSFCSPDLEFLTIKCRQHYLPRDECMYI